MFGLEIMIRKKWIGMAKVRPRPGNTDLGEAIGAFVAAIGFADSREDYVGLVTRLLNDEGFDVEEIADIELYEDRVQKFSVSPGIQDLANSVEDDGHFGLGSFHTFRE
jgi:hypothetical protein